MCVGSGLEPHPGGPHRGPVARVGGWSRGGPAGLDMCIRVATNDRLRGGGSGPRWHGRGLCRRGFALDPAPWDCGAAAGVGLADPGAEVGSTSPTTPWPQWTHPTLARILGRGGGADSGGAGAVLGPAGLSGLGFGSVVCSVVEGGGGTRHVAGDLHRRPSLPRARGPSNFLLAVAPAPPPARKSPSW